MRSWPSPKFAYERGTQVAIGVMDTYVVGAVNLEQLQTSVLTDLARDWRMFGKLHEGIHA
ncbi:hypothetical protein AcW2_000912 [Taiwanofungus camphoratus]|nr:hypothetical protein AcW2_000912 [Antrodia cinnamomea]